MGQTVVEKIAQRHRVGMATAPVAAGDYLMLRPRRVMSHDNSLAIMRKFAATGATRIVDRRQPVIVLDHDIQNPSPETRERYRAIEDFAGEHGIEFHPAGSGIGHQVMVEQLHALPGAFVVAADSHANMYGALGALGTALGRSDAAAIWATGVVWWQVPRSVQVLLHGALSPDTTGKDVILALCGGYSDGRIQGAALEFAGPGVAGLDIDARLTIANMTTEWGAIAGWFPVDEVTLDFIGRRRAILGERGVRRAADDDLRRWATEPPGPDADASYAGRLTLDLASVAPHVSGPDSVQLTTPLARIEARRVAIHKAYLVSCVNSRSSDIAAAARAMEGRPVAEGVRFYIAAASREAQAEAEAGGAWQTLLDAGALPLPSGCGPCIGLGAGLLEAGEVGISATNRNFKGRMGSRDATCYLANPAVVAASAAAGFIRGPGGAASRQLVSAFEPAAAKPPGRAPGALLPGFPSRIRGPLVFLPRDHLDTDGIYGKDHLYRDLEPPAMARVVFENYDPTLASLLAPGDVIVGGFDFGSGSSREQAVTALRARGIALVIAAGFSSTYLRNAFNNGFLCVACPDLVARLRECFRERILGGEKSIRPGEGVDVDFVAGTIGFRDETFDFPPLGEVPQALVVDGGIVNRIRRQLQQASPRSR